MVLRDLMPVAREEEQAGSSLTPEHEVLREVEGLAGEVDFEVLLRRPARLRPAQPVLAAARRARYLVRGRTERLLVLRSDLPLAPAPTTGAAGGIAIRAGERTYLSLDYAEDAPAVIAAARRSWPVPQCERSVALVAAPGRPAAPTRGPTATRSYAVRSRSS